ncbi:MAG: LolA family protein [Candidatus Eiseniibacteriota bacterium]
MNPFRCGRKRASGAVAPVAPVALLLALAVSPALALASTTDVQTVDAQTAGTAETAFLAELERARTERARTVESLAADVVVSLAAPAWEGTGTCEGRLLARRPGALRLRGYGGLSTVFDAATDGQRFGLYIPALGHAVLGDSGQESLLTAGLPILPGEIVRALFGEPYGASDQKIRVRSLTPETWVAWTLADGHEVRARYRRNPVLIERAELWAGDKRVAKLEYRDYRKRKGVWWPTRIEFDWPEERGKLALEFSSVTFQVTHPADAFRLVPPEGVPVVDLKGTAP